MLSDLMPSILILGAHMLSVLIRSVLMKSALILSGLMLIVIELSVFIVSVIMLNFIMLSVLEPIMLTNCFEAYLKKNSRRFLLENRNPHSVFKFN
jgi:hypothetical protein